MNKRKADKNHKVQKKQTDKLERLAAVVADDELDEVKVEPFYTDAPTEEISLEELEERLDGATADLEMERIIDTQHTDGHTYNPWLAQEQGLVYTPPDDPPVLPSGDGQNVRMAAGFAQRMSDSDPDVEELPATVDNQDLDLEDDIAELLQNSALTSDLDEIEVRVRNGVAYLFGTVDSEDMIAEIIKMVTYLDGINEVVSRLETEL